MPRVVPSTVVDFIISLWPEPDNRNKISKLQGGQLAGLLDLTDQIPSELITIDGHAYAELTCAKAHIKQKLLAWSNDPREPGWLDYMRGIDKPQAAVEVILAALQKCPDSHPAPGTAELTFIPDADFRQTLRIDIAEASRALSNSEWKATTVLAGSVVEALLLWFLREKPETEIDAAIAALTVREDQTTPKPPKKRRRPASELEWWPLDQFIEVAHELKGLKELSRDQAHLAREFRNLIHPAAARRRSQRCNRPTAFSAVAAMDLVIGDLTQLASAAKP